MMGIYHISQEMYKQRHSVNDKQFLFLDGENRALNNDHIVKIISSLSR